MKKVANTHWIECDGDGCARRSPGFRDEKTLRDWIKGQTWKVFGCLPFYSAFHYCPTCWEKLRTKKPRDKERLLAKLKGIAADLDDLRDDLLKSSLCTCEACEAACGDFPSVCKVTML